MNILLGYGLINLTHDTGKEKELNFGCVPKLIIVTCMHSSRILRTFSLAKSCKIVPSSSVQKENEETEKQEENVKTPNGENSQSRFHIHSQNR